MKLPFVNPICARRVARGVVIAAFGWLASAGLAQAQLLPTVSPGKLAAAHASLEGVSTCLKCHDQGLNVTARKCLGCHEPIAQRLARKTGVHRNHGDDCVTCHKEHAGTEGPLLQFDQKGFDHAANTSFPLDGKHGSLVGQCSACHKTRSFLNASTACASCHSDTHKGSLGTNCQSCHSTKVAFADADTQFDHTRAAFQLVGAHKTLTCARCHPDRGIFKGVKYGSCTDCHKPLHGLALGATCTSCHTKDSWRTTTVNHAETAYPLKGKHARVECAACHKQSPVKVKPASNTCTACHADVHRGSFTQDCKACHTELGFEEATFDHSQTQFPLVDKHDGLACVKCHTETKPKSRPLMTIRLASSTRPSPITTVDFKGLKTTCVSCHTDVHQTELGAACETCHSPAAFKLPVYTHQRPQDFFGAQHTTVTCEKCHTTALAAPARSDAPVVRVGFKSTSMACASCHKDPHLGQQGTDCQSCHTIQRQKFAVTDFSHERTRFTMAGRHQSLTCAECHKSESGVFPAGFGTAVRYRGLGTECRACHEDVHLGQNSERCETCHGTVTFKMSSYKHTARSLSAFFTGKHSKAACADCHKSWTGQFPSGTGTAVRFRMDSACVNCHTDVHRGALGPNCATCHRP